MDGVGSIAKAIDLKARFSCIPPGFCTEKEGRQIRSLEVKASESGAAEN
jgi:hypothetical protein